MPALRSPSSRVSLAHESTSLRCRAILRAGTVNAGTGIRGGELKQELSIERADRDGVEVLALGGELDIATAPSLERELTGVFDRAARGLVLDLTELAFFDSTGINIFFNAYNRARKLEMEFALVNP